MFMIGKVSPEKEKLVRVAKECLEVGMKAARPFGYVGDIGHAVQKHAEKNGFRWFATYAVMVSDWNFMKSRKWLISVVRERGCFWFQAWFYHRADDQHGNLSRLHRRRGWMDRNNRRRTSFCTVGTYLCDAGGRPGDII